MKREVYFPFLRHLSHEQIECSVQEHPDTWKTLKNRLNDTPYNCLPNKRMAIKQVCCTSAAKTPEVSMPLRKKEQSFARIEGELLYCVSASTRLWSG